MPATKLYLPYGTFGAGADRRQEWYSPHTDVILHWFRLGRAEPIAPYSSLILGYRSLNAEQQARAERIVDEFFSEAEFHRLRDYLRDRHRNDLRTAILMVPVTSVRPDSNSKAGALRPFYPVTSSETVLETGEGMAAAESVLPLDPEGGFCRLAEEEGYTLDFPVWGYYTAPARSAPSIIDRSARPFAFPPIRAFSPPSDGSIR